MGRIGQAEGDVHHRPAGRLGMPLIETLRAIDHVVEQIGLPPVELGHFGQPAELVDDPVGHQLNHVDGEGGRGVQQRLALGQHLVVDHRRQIGRRTRDQVVADDDDRDARRTGVLFGAGEQDAVFLHSHRPREEVGRGIADQGHVADGRLRGELDALDRFVHGEVGVGRVRVELQLVLFGHAVEIARLAVPGHVHGPLGFGFVVGLFAPRAAKDVIGRLARAMEQIHGHHAELEQGPALEEEHPVVVRNTQQRAEVGLGLVDDFVEGLGAVADLQNGDARARQGQQVALGLLKSGQGEHGRTGGEIVHALFHSYILIRRVTRENKPLSSVASAARLSSSLRRAGGTGILPVLRSNTGETPVPPTAK